MIYRQLPSDDRDRRRYEPLPVVPRWQRVAVCVLVTLLVATSLVAAVALVVALS